MRAFYITGVPHRILQSSRVLGFAMSALREQAINAHCNAGGSRAGYWRRAVALSACLVVADGVPAAQAPVRLNIQGD
jgi:post-segregation antitoxin (ccd killing protein)